MIVKYPLHLGNYSLLRIPMPHITRCITEPVRDSRNLSFDQRLKAEDSGLILAWENGRRDQSIELDLKQSFEKGALPLAVWKGGVDPEVKSKLKKVGSFLYLAYMQGLLGKDLDVNTYQDLELICALTGVKVTFTSDVSKLSKVA